jgi:AraC-like DNA-binding protein
VVPGISGPAGYVEWPVAAAGQRYVACSWTAGLGSPVERSSEAVLPDGCMDIIWDGEHLFVAGPDTRPNPTSVQGPFAVGVRFWPGSGPRVLDLAAYEVRDQRVALDCLWNDAAVVADRLDACATLREAAWLLEQCILERLPGAKEPDPVVEAAVGLWRLGSARADVAGLAEDAALTERQLHRRFVHAVGYGPRLLRRVLRLQAFLALCGSPRLGLAELAVRAGYADQAHLSRDTRALAGRTPAELRASRTHVRNVQDS